MKNWFLLTSLAALTACASVPASAPATPEKVAPKTREITIETAYPTKVTSLYPDGQVAGIVSSTWDAEGFLVKEESATANGVIQETKIGKRQGLTNQISTLNGSGEVQSVKTVTVDADGRLLKEVFANGKGQVQSTNEYTYTADGKVQLWLSKGPADNLLARTEYVYENGYNTVIKLFDDKPSLVKTFVNGFDGKGNLVQKKELEADGTTVATITVLTWENGKLVKEDVQNAKGSSQRMVEYKLDNQGMPATATWYDRRGKVTEIKKFEYQWLKKTKVISE